MAGAVVALQGGAPSDRTLSEGINSSRARFAAEPIISPACILKYPTKINVPADIKTSEKLHRQQTCLAELQASIQFESNGADTAYINHIQLEAKNKYSIFNIATITRPATDKLFIQQLELVKLQAVKAKRQDCMNEILSQLTPALPYFASLTGIQPNKHKWTLELLELVIAFSSTNCMRFKEAFQCPRPVFFSPDVMPIVPTPEHCTLPSGHSTESFAIAHTLRALFVAANVKNLAINDHLIEMAQQVAQNRTVAGLHFPVDSAVGCALGTSVAEYFVQRCTGSGGWESRSFECDKFVLPTGPRDFSAHEVLFTDQPYIQKCPEGQALPGGYLMTQMWAWALAEWA